MGISTDLRGPYWSLRSQGGFEEDREEGLRQGPEWGFKERPKERSEERPEERPRERPIWSDLKSDLRGDLWSDLRGDLRSDGRSDLRMHRQISASPENPLRSYLWIPLMPSNLVCFCVFFFFCKRPERNAQCGSLGIRGPK